MKRIILILIVLWSGVANAQQSLPPYYNDIQEFKKMDSTVFPAPNSILFIGSSSFTMWRDVQEYFPEFSIINRGFGGSTLLDQIRYVEDVVYPYKPKQILIYCGENDLASSDSVDGKMVLERFQRLYKLIRAKLPKVHIAYVSMKPSPSRQLLLPKMRDGNSRIQEFLKKQDNTAYIDVYKEMIDAEGKPIAELFLDDNLHMNKKGYAIWKKAIAPILKK
jgi:lysophospholipase L1-like esterase